MDRMVSHVRTKTALEGRREPKYQQFRKWKISVRDIENEILMNMDDALSINNLLL